MVNIIIFNVIDFVYPIIDLIRFKCAFEFITICVNHHLSVTPLCKCPNLGTKLHLRPVALVSVEFL